MKVGVWKTLRRVKFFGKQNEKERRNSFQGNWRKQTSDETSVSASCGYPVKVHCFDLLLEERSDAVDNFVQ